MRARASKYSVFFLLLSTSFFWSPAAQAQQTGQIIVICANDAGVSKEFRVGWDNTTGFFEGKGNIAALFCQIASGGYKEFISTTAPEITWYYNGVAPTPVQSDTATPSPSVSPTPSPTPQQTETPTVVETAPQPTPPAIVETPTAIVETATVPSSIETQTVSSETTTAVQDTATVVDTSTPTSNPPVPSVPAPPLAVEPQPTPVPVAQPAPQPEPAPIPEPVVVPDPVVIADPPPEVAPVAEPTPVVEPAPEPVPEIVPEPQPEVAPEEPPVVEPEPVAQPPQEPEPKPVVDIAPEPPVVAAPNATDAEKEIVAQAIIEQAHGEPVTAQAIADAGLTYADLPPETPVEVREDKDGNQVVITAEVAAALEVLANPAELINAIFTDPAQALLALSSIGADMSPQERAQSQKTVVAAVIVGQIAGQAAVTAAAGAAAYRRKP